MQRTDIEEVAHETFRVRGSIVNWYLVRDGRDLTLVDAGYPGNTADVESSIRLVGHDPRDVRALLITHAHADHIGAAEHLDAAFGVPAYCSAAEVAHARRERRQQVTPAQVVANAWRPGVLPWALRAVRLGAHRAPPSRTPSRSRVTARSTCPVGRSRYRRPGTPTGTAPSSCRPSGPC